MNIEVRKLKINKEFSEETICFKGELYLDGKKVGYCENDGHGGCTNYYGIETYHSEDIKRMEDYCKTLPKVKYGNNEWKQTLGGVIDDIVDNVFNRKQKESDMKKGLCIKKENENGMYNIVTWKKPYNNIENLLKHPQGKDVLKKVIQEYKDKGFIILNTNLPQEVM